MGGGLTTGLKHAQAKNTVLSEAVIKEEKVYGQDYCQDKACGPS